MCNDHIDTYDYIPPSEYIGLNDRALGPPTWPGEPSARGVAPPGLTEFQVLQRASVSLDAQRPVGERAGLA